MLLKTCPGKGAAAATNGAGGAGKNSMKIIAFALLVKGSPKTQTASETYNSGSILVKHYGVQCYCNDVEKRSDIIVIPSEL